MKERPTKQQDGEIAPLLGIFHIAETNSLRKTSLGRACLLLLPKGSDHNYFTLCVWQEHDGIGDVVSENR